MTEAEWLTVADARPLLEFVKDKTSDRKLRLFGAACCRRIWNSMWEGCHPGVEAAERYAEGLAGPEALQLARRACMGAPDAATAALHAVEWVLGGDAGNIDLADPWQWAEAEQQARLFREFVGNPFQPSDFRPDWHTDTAVLLARLMYESGDFSAMPILADALQDAGCADERVLRHSREPGEHVRGCWVVDLVLGRE